jgi:predicted 2-oxoglutarate/Fe(II)-dependent dioxygenase YbiX
MNALVATPAVATLDECQQLRREIAATFDDRWEHARKELPLARLRHTLLDQLRDRCRAVVRTAYRPRELWINYAMLSVMRPGATHAYHADNCRWDEVERKWVPNHTPYRTYTSLLYLSSDFEFEGGALELPGLGIQVTPKPGVCVAFPCSAWFLHGVPTITKGERWALAIWYTDQPAHQEPGT